MSYSTFIALDGTGNQFPQNSVRSSLDSNFIITVIVMLKRPLTDQGLTLKEYANQILAKTANVLTREKFLESFSVSDQDINKVTEFANFFGMTVVDSSPDNALIKLTSTVSILNRAFKVNLDKITIDIDEYFGHIEPISIPTELSNVIEHVFGLDSFSQSLKTPLPTVVDSTTVVNADEINNFASGQSLKYITPIQAASAYNFPPVDGLGQCIGIIQYGGGYSKKNLDLSFNRVGLVTPTIVDVSVNGGYNNQQYTTASPDIKNYSTEVALDIFVVGCVVPRAKIAVYFNNSALITHFIDPIIQAVNDTENNPSVISISWGYPETYQNDNPVDIVATDQILAQAVVLGITICCSTGDSGAYSDYQTLSVTYPASSPYVLAVGGTSLILNPDGTINSETAWSGSGGGLSKFEAVPSWQSALNLTSRAIPDVSANADPRSGYTFYSYYYNSVSRVQSSSTFVSIGGTSASAPLIAGLVTRLNQIFRKKIHSINQLFYSNPSGFNDITVGDNNFNGKTGYTSVVGWDAVTGLGSPNGVNLLTALASQPFLDNVKVTTFQNTTASIFLTLAAVVTSVAIVQPPFYGTAVVSSTTVGLIYYTPPINYFGNDEILITVSTPIATSNVAFISITVLSDPPVAFVIYQKVPLNSARTPIQTGFSIRNYYESLTAIPAVVNDTVVTLGTLESVGSMMYYTPPRNYTGSDRFQYYATSPSGDSNVADVFITIPAPPPPIAYDVKRFIIYNSSNNFITPNVNGIYTAISAPAFSLKGGTISIFNNVSMIYNPPANYVGDDAFSYRVDNPSGFSNANVAITVLTTASAIVAYDISLFVLENSKSNYITPSITNSPVTGGGITIVNSASQGVAYVDGNFIYYTPNQNYVGFDRLSYKITNTYGNSAPANIFISVNSTQYAPVASESSATVYENSINNQLTPVISNSATNLVINNQPNFGTAVVSTSKTTILYTPTTGFQGIDYFYFSGYNKSGISKLEKFYINVKPLLIPVAYSTSTVVSYNSVDNRIFPKVLFPFNSINISKPPLHGVATASNTVIYYTPSPGYSGTDTFAFIVGNTAGISNSASVGVTINPSASLIVNIANRNLPRGVVGVVYQPLTIQGSNGTGPYTTVITSLIPAGMTFVNNVLSGVPSINSAGVYFLSVTVTDSSTPVPLSTTTNYILDIASVLNKLITAESFNDFQSNSYNLLTTTYGAIGKSSQVLPDTDLVTALGWNNVYDDTLRSLIHQTGAASSLPNILKTSTGTFISLGQLDALNAQILNLQNSFLSVDPNQLLLDTTGVRTQSTSTSLLQRYYVTYDWVSADQARIFFNLGGYIRGVIQNTSTMLTSELNFRYINYSNNAPLTVQSTDAVINGTGTIDIRNKNDLVGSTIIATFTITPNTGGARMLFTATDFYSTGVIGGIEAPRPVVQLFGTAGQLTVAPVSAVTVTGNTAATLTIALTNASPNLVIITSSDISYQSTVAGMPLTVTYTNLPLAISTGTSANLQISLQNFTAVGGVYPTTFNITAYVVINSVRQLMNAVAIPVQLNINYGVVVTPGTVSGTVTAPTTFNFTVTGYGGKLQSATITPGDFNEYYVGTVAANANPLTPLTATFTKIGFDPSYIVNGVYTNPQGFIVQSYSTEYPKNNGYVQFKLDTSGLIINVTDRNLGSWLSPCDVPNGIMGFSYDKLNGVPTLTMGFGSVPAINSGGYTVYSANSLKSLGRFRYLNYSSYSQYQRSSNSSYSTFLNTYGVWNSSGLVTASLVGSNSFFVRYATNFQWQFSVDNFGSFYIDNALIFTHTNPGNYTSVQSGSISLTAGFHTIRWECSNSGGPGSMGISITYTTGNNAGYDAWSTLDLCSTSWAEITRISLINDGTRRGYVIQPLLSHTDVYTQTYSSYFKDGSGNTGMWTVFNDGFGNIQIYVNNLSNTSGNSDIDTTLQHVTDLMYYYSPIDQRVAASNLAGVFGNNYTYIFVGFYFDGSVVTAQVPVPPASPLPMPVASGGGGLGWLIPVIITIAQL